jgi:hypothetical protein
MKKLLFACLALVSLNSFAQSYVIMDNGIAITMDRSGFVYDFGNYSNPQKITLKGGTFFVEDGGILATVDEKGALFRKYEVIPEKILGKGINYFLSDAGELYTISRQGLVTITTNDEYKKATNFGGNFFAVTTDAEKKLMDLYTVNLDGKVTKIEIPDFKAKDIVIFGGSYFMTNRGLVYTVTSDGTALPSYEARVGVIQKRGGNYFIDSSGMFYTVSETGVLAMPGLPINLKLSAITKFGSNYFVDLSGRLFVVDKDGNVFERIMRDYDFRNARVISL